MYCVLRYDRLLEIGNSKIDQIANYIVTHLEEVTPLALEKLLFFSNGVNYALNGKQLIPNASETWMHGHPTNSQKCKKSGTKHQETIRLIRKNAGKVGQSIRKQSD